MSNPPGLPSKEQPSTYVWQDQLTSVEIEHLQLQDHLVTQAMGVFCPSCQIQNDFCVFWT